MSSVFDPSGGDGPNKIGIDPAEESSSDEVAAEEDEEEDSRVEAAGRSAQRPHGGHEGGGAHKPQPTASSKGINPVQHSE